MVFPFKVIITVLASITILLYQLIPLVHVPGIDMNITSVYTAEKPVDSTSQYCIIDNNEQVSVLSLL